MNQIKSFIGLTKRNVLVYLKDGATVFFSMLAPIIVLGLYVLFLKQTYVSSISNQITNMGLEANSNSLNAFINSWLIAGLLGTSCITVPLSSLSIMVYDREHGIDNDFNSTPVYKGTVLLSYLIASVINTFIIGAGIVIIGFIVLSINGVIYSFASIILAFLVLLLGSISGTGAMMFVMCFFKKSSTVGAFTGIVCAAVGFFIGAYMPISEFDEWIQIVSSILPGSHICGLFRNIFMIPSLDYVNNFINIPEFATGLKSAFGIKVNFFGNEIDYKIMAIYATIVSFIIVGVDIFIYKKTSKRK